MKTIGLALGLVVLTVGCGAQPLDSVAAACAAPDGAAAPADTSRHDAGAPIDLAGVDRAGFSDGPLPPGIVANPEHPVPGLTAYVELGLLADLQASLRRHDSSFGIGDKVIVTVGYGIDIVYLKGGSVGPPRGEDLTKGGVHPMVISFGGPRTDIQDPAYPPHPEFGSARALFDAMTNVPEVVTAEGRVRRSPGHRVECLVPATFDAAYCTFTGFLSAYLR